MPKIHRAPLPAGHRLTPQTHVASLGKSPILSALSGIELVVYLRLISAVHDWGESKLTIGNADLYREPRTAGKALIELERLKLIRISHNPGRKIVVL